MWMENIMVCGFLGICSIHDCRTRKIPCWLLGTGLVLAVCCCLSEVAAGGLGWGDFLSGLIPGAVMLLYSRMTEDKMGTADGLMALPVGLLHQWQLCAAEIFTACLLTFAVAVYLLVSRKGTRSTQIPFAPFFLAAVVFFWVRTGIHR